MIPYANYGLKNVLKMINCFTKLVFAIPLKTKTSVEIVKALRPILRNNKMKHLQTSQDNEWYNSTVKICITYLRYKS